MKCCNECVNYYRHYAKIKDKYTPVWCGHCIFPRTKKREPDAKSCGHFKPSDDTTV